MTGARRRVSAVTVLVAGAAVAALLTSAGCTDATTAAAPYTPLSPPATTAVSAADADRCAAFLAALPPTLAGADRVVPGADDGARGATYGDPAISVRCGVVEPDGFDPTAVPGPDEPSPCTVVNQVGWYVPPEETSGGVDATLSAVTYAPLVSVTVPRSYLPEGSAAALAELAPVVRSTLARTLRCPGLG